MKAYKDIKVGDIIMIGTHEAYVDEISVVRRPSGVYHIFISYWFANGFGSSIRLLADQLDKTSIMDFDSLFYEDLCEFKTTNKNILIK